MPTDDNPFFSPTHRAAPPRTLREAVVEPFHEFITRKGWSHALLILTFLLFYKLGDSMCTALATPFGPFVYGVSNFTPRASSRLQNASRFLTSNPM